MGRGHLPGESIKSLTGVLNGGGRFAPWGKRHPIIKRRGQIVLSNLEQAIHIACEAHAGQTDKAGAPYVLHPLRVMFSVDTDEERIVAVLHDTVEDSEDVDLHSLKDAGFSETILTAIDCLTKRDGEAYDVFIDRLINNPIARSVKLADIEDNMNIRRMDELAETDLARLGRYHRAWKKLTALKTPS